MTSRERVIKALKGNKVDQVPVFVIPDIAQKVVKTAVETLRCLVQGIQKMEQILFNCFVPTQGERQFPFGFGETAHSF
jgi:hypothetical protein